MIRALLLLGLLILPAPATAGIHIHLRVNSHYPPYILCHGPLTTQTWMVIPNRPVSTNAPVAANSTLFINQVGQVWQRVPRPVLPEPIFNTRR